MSILSQIGLALIWACDLLVLFGLIWWRRAGRPVPAGWEWARTHWATRWLFAIRERPVLVGF